MGLQSTGRLHIQTVCIKIQFLKLSNFRIPIEDLFYKGKNPRGVKNKKKEPPAVTENPVVLQTTTISDEDDDYYDVFDDFYDYGDESEEGVESEPINDKAPSEPKSEEEDRGSFLDGLPSDIYCDLVTTLDKRCYEQSILEIWDFDRDIIFNLTQEDILEAVNTLTVRWRSITSHNILEFAYFRKTVEFDDHLYRLRYGKCKFAKLAKGSHKLPKMAIAKII